LFWTQLLRTLIRYKKDKQKLLRQNKQKKIVEIQSVNANTGKKFFEIWTPFNHELIDE